MYPLAHAKPRTESAFSSNNSVNVLPTTFFFWQLAACIDVVDVVAGSDAVDIINGSFGCCCTGAFLMFDLFK